MASLTPKAIIVVCLLSIVRSQYAKTESGNKQTTVTITPISEKAGVYFDPVAPVQFVTNTWHFVVELNVNILLQRIEDIKKNVTEILKQINTNGTAYYECKASDKIKVSEIELLLLKQIQLLEIRHKDLFDSVGEQNKIIDKGKRKKRSFLNGAFNIVGTVNKYFFGTMDANDAQTLHDVAGTTQALNKQVKVLTTNVIQLAEYVDQHLGEIASLIDSCDKLRHLINIYLQQLTQIDSKYNEIEDSLYWAKSNMLHRFVMSPSKLLQHIQDIHDRNINWPIDLNLASIHTLLGVINTHVFHTGSKLIYFIEIPLVENKAYSLYQTVTVPYCNNNGTCVMLMPASRYIGESEMQFIRMDDFDNCKHLVDKLLCFRTEVEQTIPQETECDIKVKWNELQSKVDLKSVCDLRVGKFKDEIFHKLASVNRWLYVVRKATELQINCESNERVILKGAGIIETNKVCKLQTSKSILKSVELKTWKNKTYTKNVSLVFDISSTLKQAENLYIPITTYSDTLQTNELKDLTWKLKDLKTIEDHNKVNFKDPLGDDDDGWFSYLTKWSHLRLIITSLVLVLISVTFLGTLFKIYHICFKTKTQPVPLYQPPMATAPPANKVMYEFS